MLDSRGGKIPCSKLKKNGEPCKAFAVNSVSAVDPLCALHGGRSEGVSRCTCQRFSFPHKPSKACGKNVNIILVPKKPTRQPVSLELPQEIKREPVPITPPPDAPAPVAAWPEPPPHPVQTRKDRLAVIAEELAKLHRLTIWSRTDPTLARIMSLEAEQSFLKRELLDLERPTEPKVDPEMLQGLLESVEDELSRVAAKRQAGVEIREHFAMLERISELKGEAQSYRKALANLKEEPTTCPDP